MTEDFEQIKKEVVDNFTNHEEIIFDDMISFLVKLGHTKIQSYETVWFLIEHGVLDYETHDTCRFLKLKK